MKNKKKVVLNGILFVAVFGLTIWGVFRGEDLGAMWDALTECNEYWLIPAIFCVLFFIWGESIIIWYMMRSCGIHLKKRICFLFSSVGFFFSCLTPSATGGQPMQIYYMRKENIPVPVATVILMIVTIIYKLVLVVAGLAILLFGRGFMSQYLGEILPIFYLGIALNVFCVTFMMVVVFHPSFAKEVMLKGLKILEKLHLIKKKERRLVRLESSMDRYHDTAAYMSTHIGLIIQMFLITCVQRIALFAVPCFVYRAFHLTGTGWFTILTLQAVIAISVDMLPLPGGMGISETLFMIIFAPVFGVSLLPGMVLSRGLGYYSELLTSAVFTLVTVAVFAHRPLKAQIKKKVSARRHY